jgi:hypothetical protein
MLAGMLEQHRYCAALSNAEFEPLRSWHAPASRVTSPQIV